MSRAFRATVVVALLAAAPAVAQVASAGSAIPPGAAAPGLRVQPPSADSLIAVQESKLNASDAAAFDRFGFAVAVSGNAAVVGANQDDHDGKPDAGSAYVFVRSGSTWIQQWKLT